MTNFSPHHKYPRVEPDIVVEEVLSCEAVTVTEPETETQEEKLLNLKQTLETYADSLCAFQRWFEPVFEEVLTTFDDVKWLEEQILNNPTVDEHEGVGRFTPLLLAKAYARQAQQIEQIIGENRQHVFLSDNTRTSHQRAITPAAIFNVLKDAIFAAAIAVFKMIDSSPQRQKVRYQRIIPKGTLTLYKGLLRHLCSVDTLAPTCGHDVISDFNDDVDPREPIKSSLERTVELLQLEESLVDTFLVHGHKKLVLQTRAHPRPSVLLKQHAEMLYQSVWEQFYTEYHFLRRMLAEVEFLLETRQPIAEVLRLDILDQFDDWPTPFLRRCKDVMRVRGGHFCAQLMQRCICRSYFHFALGSA